MIGSFITTMMIIPASHLVQSFLVKHQIPQVTQPPYSPDWAPCDFWFFPKLKSPLKEKDFRLLKRFRKIQQGSWWQLGELCEVSRCIHWRALKCHCHVQCFLYLISPSINASIFHGTWLYTFQTHLFKKNKYSVRQR